MGLVVFGIIIAVIGVLISVFGRRTTVNVVGGILVALLGVGLLIGGIVETALK